MITAQEAAKRTQENVTTEREKMILQVNGFLGAVNRDIEAALKGKEAKLYYKMDDLSKHAELSRYPWLAREIECERQNTKTVISEFGKFVVNALVLIDYKVELTPYSLTISWEHLVNK